MIFPYLILCFILFNNEVHSEAPKNKTDIRIIIVGAGISGLGAAKLLHENGYDNVTILEGQNRIGGRINTVPFGDGIIELGAQWIHGQGDNSVYQLGLQYNLIDVIDDDESDEDDDARMYSTEEGETINSEKAVLIQEVLENIGDKIKSKHGYDANNNIISLGEVIESRFKHYLKRIKNLNMTEKHLWAAYDWIIRDEIIDIASTHAKDLYDVSVDEYAFYKVYDGNSEVNWKKGYKTLLDQIATELPKNFIRLNTPVKHIQIENSLSASEVRVTVEGQENSLIADHVIVTSSIGYLKKHYKTLFDNLPENKAKVIETLGFGTIAKMYLEFEKSFWDNETLGFQFCWTIPDSGKFPLWTRSIIGFEAVKHQPNLLVAWIGGAGAPLMEAIQDEHEIIDTLSNLFRTFYPQINYAQPIRMIRTEWGNNPFILGSYSYISVDFTRTNLSKSELSDPLLCNGKDTIDKPCVLFAGEGTDDDEFSTTHGALNSGRRDAQRIINYWSK